MEPKLVLMTGIALTMLPAVIVMVIVLCTAIRANEDLKRVVAKQDLQLNNLMADFNRVQALSETRRKRLITTERKLQACPHCSSSSQSSS